jgi:hypothetical protein
MTTQTATFTAESVLSAKSFLSQVVRQTKPMDIAPQASAKMPRPGCIRRTFIDALLQGATADELEALIPETNKATVRTYCKYIASLGFGVKQDGNTFWLVLPKKLEQSA